MEVNTWEQTIVDIKKELAKIKSEAIRICHCCENLSTEAETFKVEFLLYSIEKQRISLVRQRGCVSVIRDAKRMWIGTEVFFGSLIFGALAGRDDDTVFKMGISGFDGVIERSGDTKWAVSLGNSIDIVPRDNIPAQGIWVTLVSLIAALEELKVAASQGEIIGDFDNTINRLKKTRRKLVYFFLPINTKIRK